MNMLDEALKYYAMGWSIVPVRPGTKKPSLRSWKPYQKDRPSEKKLREWFSKGDKGLAVVLGEVSGGFVCRDFDRMDSYEAWAKEYPTLAATLPTVATGRSGGGRHVYCRVDLPEVLTMLKGAGSLKLGDGEFRVSDSICLLPPSVHPSGTSYSWLIPPNGEIPLCDPFEVGLVKAWNNDADFTQHPQQTQQTQHTQSIVERGGGIIEAICEQLDPINFPSEVWDCIYLTLPQREGVRNECIWKFCRKLARFYFGRPDQEMKPFMREWHRLALPVIVTKEWDESWHDFQVAWGNIILPDGTTLDDLLEQVKSKPFPPAVLAFRFDHPKIRLLMALFHEFQSRLGPGGDFFLSCRDAGRLLGVSHEMANNWINLLLRYGVAELVERGTQTKRLASRYRYLL